jgi:hypothetical protein
MKFAILAGLANGLLILASGSVQAAVVHISVEGSPGHGSAYEIMEYAEQDLQLAAQVKCGKGTRGVALQGIKITLASPEGAGNCGSLSLDPARLGCAAVKTPALYLRCYPTYQAEANVDCGQL